MQILSLAVVLLSAFVLNCNADVDERWLYQRLDHFDPISREYWDQRYISHNDYYAPGGPIFIYIGGGVEIYGDYIERGLIHDIARDARGYLFALEHRYYGVSRPTPDLTTENMRYLNADQVLADVAYFITFIKENYNAVQSSKVFLYGRGYGATLAVWARQKYPHLVYGVWASSAHLRAKVDYEEYFENVGVTIARVGGEECYARINRAINYMDNLITQSATAEIEEKLNLCTEIDTTDDQDIATLSAGIAQVVGKTFLENARYGDIELACIALTDPAQPDDFTAFANWITTSFGNGECANFSYAITIEAASQTEWTEDAINFGSRQDYFRQCTQYGTFLSSNSAYQPFGNRFPVSYYKRACSDIFGEELINQFTIEEAIRRTNDFYGGNNPRGVNNVFFTQGELDPNRNLGVLEDLNPTSPAVVITLQSFSRDLESLSINDNTVLRETKIRGRELIDQWINAEDDEYVPEPVDPENPGETEPEPPIDPEQPEGTTEDPAGTTEDIVGTPF